MRIISIKYLVGFLLLFLVTASLSFYGSYKYWLTVQEISVDSNISFSFLAIQSLLEEDYDKALDYEIAGLEQHLVELYAIEIQEGVPLKFNHYMSEISRIDTGSPKRFSHSLYELDSIVKINYPDMEKAY